jgi:pimeloyl-ACP methyl ester carboxylesterase
MKRILVSILIVILLIVLVGPFLVPVPPLEGTLSIDQLAEPDSQFADVQGLRLHYKSAGTGDTPLILLHGFGASVFSWHKVLAPLGERRLTVAFDRPAFGLTERPMQWSGENPYSPEFQAKLTVGLMDELGIQQAILVGNSAGGAIAALTALRYPQRVKALILVDPAIYTGGSPGFVRLLAKTPQMQRLGPLVARNIQNWGQDFAASAWHDPSKITDEIWAGYTRPLQAENWDRALWNLTAASQNLKLGEQLERFQLPILVITGDDDRIVPTADSVRLASELPNAELIVIPNCGHVPHEECHQAFLIAVEDFLARLP